MAIDYYRALPSVPDNLICEGRRLLKKIMFLSVAVVFLLVSLSQFFTTTRYYDLIYTAREIEAGNPVNTSYVGALLGEVYRHDMICRSDIVKAVTTNVLRNLDVIGSRADAEQWNRQLALARHYIEQSLACLPTDGNLWLRLAMIRWAEQASPDEIAGLMEKSQKFAPVEADVVMGRLDLWNRVPALALKKAERAVRDDLSMYDLYFQHKKSAAIQKPSPFFASMIASQRTERIIR